MRLPSLHRIYLVLLIFVAALLAAPSGRAANTAAPAGDLTPHFEKNARILFQGDSITDGGRGRSADPNHILGQDYAYLIAANCGGHDPDQGWVFLNRGISGNKVTDLVGRWQTDTLDLKPDILSILIGVNDAGSIVGGNGIGVTAEQYEQVYDQILQQAAAANPRIKLVLCEPFIEPGKNVDPNPSLWGAEIKLRQAAVERLAVKYHAPVVHFQSMFDMVIQKHPAESITYWVWDGIHPTYAGHQMMADEWIRTVNQFYYSGKRH